MSTAKNIEFVYFDLGNVLVAFDPLLACANVAQQFGVPRERTRRAIYESGLQTRFEHGQISGQEYVDAIAQHLKHSGAIPSTQTVLDAASDMFWPIESMKECLQRVRDQQIRIGILSNTCSAHWDWILRQAYSLMKIEFDVTILSFEVGSMKPDGAIYLAAEEAAGTSADQILFLDDKRENVEGARQRGWKAEQCLGGEQAEAALRKWGVG